MKVTVLTTGKSHTTQPRFRAKKTECAHAHLFAGFCSAGFFMLILQTLLTKERDAHSGLALSTSASKDNSPHTTEDRHFFIGTTNQSCVDKTNHHTFSFHIELVILKKKKKPKTQQQQKKPVWWCEYIIKGQRKKQKCSYSKVQVFAHLLSTSFCSQQPTLHTLCLLSAS